MAITIAKLRQVIGDEDTPTAFTDGELTTIITDNAQSNDNATLYASAIYSLEVLLANSAKLFNYSQGQAKLDADTIFSKIEKLIDRYKTKLASALGTNVSKIVYRKCPLDDEAWEISEIAGGKKYNIDLTR